MSAARTKKKAKGPELRVVFDTSVLYTGSEADLVKQDAAHLIREHSHHPDLPIAWYLPDVVRHERQYQMQKEAVKLLTPIQKVERLLLRQLDISETLLRDGVNAIVETQLDDLGFRTLKLDPKKVDLGRLMLDACYRRPPFDKGDKEKGFRDSLIAEAFLQLVETSPRASTDCRVIFIARDELLADAVRTRTRAASNVEVLDTLEELKSLITTFVEAVNEQFVKTYTPRAKDYFLEHLFYKKDILGRIQQTFSDVLKSVPAGADMRTNGPPSVGSPRFVKKQDERVRWATRITILAEALKYWEPPPTPSSYAFSGPGATGPVISGPGSIGPGTVPPWMIGLSNLITVSRGTCIFEVVWSVKIANRRLSAPQIESIDHVGTNWE